MKVYEPVPVCTYSDREIKVGHDDRDDCSVMEQQWCCCVE